VVSTSAYYTVTPPLDVDTLTGLKSHNIS